MILEMDTPSDNQNEAVPNSSEETASLTSESEPHTTNSTITTSATLASKNGGDSDRQERPDLLRTGDTKNAKPPAVTDNGHVVSSETPEVENKKDGHAQPENNGAIPPPDGGWGWAVVFSSFLIHVIADGIVYSFGVFLTEFVEVFKVGRSAASWIGALQPAVTFSVGPLASALTNRFGCRIVTILGAVIAGVGFIISVFAPNLYYLYVTSGIMAGIGFGLIYLPAIVSVSQYFEKKRAFATGLAVCGSGFGTFVLAPITEKLVHEFSWRGAMLILGGLILNVIVCGILFRPLEAPRKKNNNPEETSLLGADGVTETEMTTEKTKVDDDVTDTSEMIFLIKKHTTPGVVVSGEGEGEKEMKSSLEIIPLTRTNGHNVNRNRESEVGRKDMDTDILVTSQEGEGSPATSQPSDAMLSSFQVHVDFANEENDSLRQVSASQCLTVPDKNGKDAALLARSDGALHRRFVNANGGAKSDKKTDSPHTPRHRKRLGSHSSASSNTNNTLSPLSRKDVFYSGSLLNIPMYVSQPDVYLATVTPVSPAHERETDGSDKSLESETKCFSFSREFRSTMKEMMNFSLLKNPVFLMFGISNFFTSIGFNMPFIFLPDRAKVVGIDDDSAAFLISVIGIANTAGRVIFGFLSDRPWVNRLFLYNTALAICGGATALSTIGEDAYIKLAIYAVVFGLFIGVYVSLTPVVLVDLLGLEYLTNSFGLLLLFQGAATFIGPPIAGALYDWTGSYNISFILMGALIALSGAMLYLLPFVQRRYNRKVPVVDILRDVDMGRQVHGDPMMEEIIHSRQEISSSSHIA